jgi:hypothetical protein
MQSLLGRERKAGHAKRRNFVGDECASCNHLNFYQQHTHLPQPRGAYALRCVTILDPKGRDSAKSSSSGSDGDVSVSNASHIAAPDSEHELLVVAMAAATAAHLVLNVVTADEGSRSAKPGGSAKGKARTWNRGREAARSV